MTSKTLYLAILGTVLDYQALELVGQLVLDFPMTNQQEPNFDYPFVKRCVAAISDLANVFPDKNLPSFIMREFFTCFHYQVDNKSVMDKEP